MRIILRSRGVAGVLKWRFLRYRANKSGSRLKPSARVALLPHAPSLLQRLLVPGSTARAKARCIAELDDVYNAVLQKYGKEVSRGDLPPKEVFVAGLSTAPLFYHHHHPCTEEDAVSASKICLLPPNAPSTVAVIKHSGLRLSLIHI